MPDYAECRRDLSVMSAFVMTGNPHRAASQFPKEHRDLRKAIQDTRSSHTCLPRRRHGDTAATSRRPRR
jgi:hypothetical protein